MSSVQQPITPELRQWIIEQAQAGVQPEAVLASMKTSGWQEEVAISALEDTLRGFLDERARASRLPTPMAVPEPLPADAGMPATLWAGDREVKVVLAMRNPRVVVFGGLLSDEECDELVDLAGRRLARSETVQTDTGAS
jgi:prolyl 4-hydroxylase